MTVKALTLHQPWASLVALGVKTIETRSWSTSYRGPLVIHAGKRPMTGCEYQRLPLPESEQWLRDCERVGLSTQDTRRFASGYDGIAWPDPSKHPLGAIVASCRLVDVVPIIELRDDRTGAQIDVCGDGSLLLWHNPLQVTNVSDQRPYGDFTPGRYTWLLEDVKPTTERCPACWNTAVERPCNCRGEFHVCAPGRCAACDGSGTCDPIPARGRQGLWNWEPA